MPPRPTAFSNLRLILGDQLNAQHSWYQLRRSDTLYVIAELPQEASYTRHHLQKLCAFFLAMADFAAHLQREGHHVLHLTLDDTASYPSLDALLRQLCQQENVTTLEYQRPDEYRLNEQLKQFSAPGVSKHCYDTEHFLLPFEEIPRQFEAGRHRRMESFYRQMRRRCDILMDGDQPEGGRWNYDADNRNKLKPADLADVPRPLVFANDVTDVRQRIDAHAIEYIGHCGATLLWPVNRNQALELLDYFCGNALPRFGRFQDAMSCNSDHQWSLFHARISFALNVKLLHPTEVLQRALDAYTASDTIAIAQIEGFVRQVLGWREYVRGIYWANMPEYRERNALAARRGLPDFFWSGATRMNCLHHAVAQSLEFAYAHHIQRLMITGNFCLLAGIDPAQVDAWYLGIYIDAIEWVEMPNTRGMSQFADGGIVASKPYAASGNYVNKMSDYCSSCHYDVKQKLGERACPFNSLYWDFMVRHRSALEKNPRVGMIFRNWDRFLPEQQEAIQQRAAWCVDNMDRL